MKIKLIFVFVLLGICALVVPAQNGSVVSDFEKNKAKLKLEKFAEGEDASSGYDYLVYKNKEEIVKIRVIWSSSANPNYWIEDHYFNNGEFFAFYRYNLTKRNYKNAKSGKNIPLVEVERSYLNGAKLTVWTENGKAVSKDDARWDEQEKEVLQKGVDLLEMYKSFQEEN